MAKLPNNFESTYHEAPELSPEGSDEDDTPTARVTQTVAHPYMLGKVRMRQKRETQFEEEPGPQMMSLRVELENAKTELNRRTVLFSNHYNSMVGKWQTEKTKREVAENVAVEKARDNVVLQRTHITLKKRAKQSTEGMLETPGADEENKRDTVIGDENVVNLTEENEKMKLELQDLKETVTLLESQISDYKQENEDQSSDLQEMSTKMVEMEDELKQNKNYMHTAQYQYKNLAGRLQDEKGKREIAENVAVNKARELEVQKRTSVMVMSSLSQNFCPDFSSVQNSLETMDYASKVSSLETEVEDLRDSKTALENIVTKFEQECNDKDSEIRELKERLFVGSYSRSPLEGNISLTQSLAVKRRSFGDIDEIGPCLVTSTISPNLIWNNSSETGTNVAYRNSPLLKGETLGRPRHKKISGVQSKEQLQQELKSKEAMINIMKEKLERMKIDGSREDPELEIQRKELEDQVGGLDRKLSSMNTGDKNTETEVDELREKLENVEKKAADFEEKTRYYQELLNKMNRSSDLTTSPRASPTPDSLSPISIPPPPPNLPPPPPPPLPEGLFGPATPHLVIKPVSKKASQLKADSRGEAMDELMSMLSSGKVHLKRAKNKAPVMKEEQPPPLALPRHVLKRQVTVPKEESELLASLEDRSCYSLKPAKSESIDDRLKVSRRQKQSSEKERSSELFQKLNQRLKTSQDQPDQSDSVQIPRIDSNPPPPINYDKTAPIKPTVRRKTTPVPLFRSPVLAHKLEEVESIPEEKETEPPSPPPIPEKRLLKQLSYPDSFTPKVKSISPLAKQISQDTLKPPDAPPVRAKPSLKGPILPPSNRESVTITAKPREELKRQKSGSTPPGPIPVKPSNLTSRFKRDSKSNSTENLSPQ